MDLFEESILGKLSQPQHKIQGAPVSLSLTPLPKLTVYDFFPFTCLQITKFLYFEKLLPKKSLFEKYLFFKEVYLTLHLRYFATTDCIEITQNKKSIRRLNIVNPYFIEPDLIEFGLKNLGIQLDESIEIKILPSLTPKPLKRPRPIKTLNESQLSQLSRPTNIPVNENFLNKKLCKKVCPFKEVCRWA